MTPPVPTVCVGGTWMLRASVTWWRHGSPFQQMLARHGCRLLDEPFRWSGELGGVPNVDVEADPADEYADAKRLVAWSEAGRALRWYQRAYAPDGIDCIAHSHGSQVAVFAAIYGCRIRRLVTVSGPVRRDMQRARRKIQGAFPWLHLYSDASDAVQVEGTLGDGNPPGVFIRSMPEAAVNWMIPGVGHSGLLEDPAKFEAVGAVRFLTEANPYLAVVGQAEISAAPPAPPISGGQAP